MLRHLPKGLTLFISLTKNTRILLLFVLIAFLYSSSLPHTASAAAGDLDQTFGIGGKVTTDFFEDDDDLEAIAIQADGRIVVCGDAFRWPGGFGLIVARYKANGTLDTGFGNGGKVFPDLYGGLPTGVAIQPNGKIVVAGSLRGDQSSDFLVVRLNPDGSLDSSFGSGGIVITDFGGYDGGSSLIIAPDGKIVVAGGSSPAVFSQTSFALARYNGDGSLDASFGLGGKVITSIANFNTGAVGIGIQPDGKIVVGSGTPIFATPAIYLARYHPDGSLDNSFGAAGIVTTPLSGDEESVRTLVLQPDGKVLLAGSTNPQQGNFSSDFLLVRYTNNGTLDASFGNGGFVTTDFSHSEVALALAVQSNGKIVAAGFTSSFTGSDFALARYLADGSLDPNFGTQGRVTTDFNGATDLAKAITVQPGGQIVAAGNSNNRNRDYALARYFGDSVFDVCVQDDSSGSLLQINTTTGDYQFNNCGGLAVGGTGTLTKRGSTLTLQHNASDRRVMVTIDTSSNRATASLQVFSQGGAFRITDRNILNNTCACN